MNGYKIELDREFPDRWKFLGVGPNYYNVPHAVIAHHAPNEKDIYTYIFNIQELADLIAHGRCDLTTVEDWDLNANAVVEAHMRLSHPGKNEFLIDVAYTVYDAATFECVSFCPDPKWRKGVALCAIDGANSAYNIPWVTEVPLRDKNTGQETVYQRIYRMSPHARLQ